MFTLLERIRSHYRDARSWVEKHIPTQIRERKDFFLKCASACSLLLTYAISVHANKSIIFGIGIPLMWSLHELGHMIACRVYRVPIRWILFLPFVGALMRTKEEFRSTRIEASVAIAGPVSGFIWTGVAIVCYDQLLHTLDPVTAREILNVIALSCIYNLMQLLITTPPFDGGRVTSIVHPGFKVFGWCVLILLFIYIERTWVITLFVLALTYWRFTFAWRRLLLISLLSGLLGLGIFLGYGNKEWWWNIGDIFVVGLAFYWAAQEVERDGKPIQLLLEWRAAVLAVKKFKGTWVDRGNDRRDMKGRQVDGRRVHPGLRVPLTRLPRRDAPNEVGERRGILKRERRTAWFFLWLGVVLLGAILSYLTVSRG